MSARLACETYHVQTHKQMYPLERAALAVAFVASLFLEPRGGIGSAFVVVIS